MFIVLLSFVGLLGHLGGVAEAFEVSDSCKAKVFDSCIAKVFDCMKCVSLNN